MASIEPASEAETAGRSSVVRSSLALSELEEAVLRTVAYSDIFDYPLTAGEIHRYLMDVTTSRDAVDIVLSASPLRDHLTMTDGYCTLAGREATVQTRRQRTEQARTAWARAFRYGRIIASLPFVRMVAVTGELAMDNVGPTSDIDYFIVTAPGRLWLTRLMVIGVVRLAGSRGPEICPNYLLSERALEFDDRNLYSAHEVAQMTPIAGLATYQALRELNDWTQRYLPNAAGPPRYVEAPLRGQALRKLAEVALGTRPGAWLERWEMNRKIRKLSGGDPNFPESAYTPDVCKGHVDGHGQRILALYADRWNTVEVAP